MVELKKELGKERSNYFEKIRIFTLNRISPGIIRM